MMWFTYLYSSLIPLGSMLISVGIFLYYWVDRYNLFKRSVIKSPLSGGLVVLAMKLLDFTLFLKAIGELFFDERIRDGFQVESIVMITVSFVYLIVPSTSIIKYFHEEKFAPKEKTYDDKMKEEGFKDSYR